MEVIGKALATIEEVDDDLKYGPNGGFTCISSTPSEDRDGDNLYQEEWKTLPDHITVDLDHGMSVATTVGSGHPYFNADGNIQTDVALSSIPRAQEVRTLIKEGHVRTVSVAFMTDKTKKSGEPRRELLNLGIVAVPSNREAIILDSKALDTRAEEIAAEKRSEDQEKSSEGTPRPQVTMAHQFNGELQVIDFASVEDAKEFLAIQVESLKDAVEAPEIVSKAPSGTGDGPALTQAIHDASVHLGAMCYPIAPEDNEDTGATDGANKSAIVTPNEARESMGLDPIEEITFTSQGGQVIKFASHEEARAFFTDMIKSLDENPELVGVVQVAGEKSPELNLEAIKPEGLTMEQFKSALTEMLTPKSPEESAPADEAAAAPSAEDWARKALALKMRVRTRL